MELLEGIKNRRGIRQFQDRPVPEDHVNRIVATAMLAPWAGNLVDVESGRTVSSRSGGQVLLRSGSVNKPSPEK
jgi:nitroreductase